MKTSRNIQTINKMLSSLDNSLPIEEAVLSYLGDNPFEHQKLLFELRFLGDCLTKAMNTRKTDELKRTWRE